MLHQGAIERQLRVIRCRCHCHRFYPLIGGELDRSVWDWFQRIGLARGLDRCLRNLIVVPFRGLMSVSWRVAEWRRLADLTGPEGCLGLGEW
jgi:hypothetical protein